MYNCERVNCPACHGSELTELPSYKNMTDVDKDNWGKCRKTAYDDIVNAKNERYRSLTLSELEAELSNNIEEIDSIEYNIRELNADVLDFSDIASTIRESIKSSDIQALGKSIDITGLFLEKAKLMSIQSDIIHYIIMNRGSGI